MKIQINTASPPASSPRETMSAQPRGAPQPAAPPAPPPPNVDTVKQVARQINDFLKSSSAGVEFSVDGDSNQVVVRIVDSQTREVIRQMPTEEMIAISKVMDQLTGLLIKQKA